MGQAGWELTSGHECRASVLPLSYTSAPPFFPALFNFYLFDRMPLSCPGWPQTCDPLASTPSAAGVTPVHTAQDVLTSASVVSRDSPRITAQTDNSEPTVPANLASVVPSGLSHGTVMLQQCSLLIPEENVIQKCLSGPLQICFLRQ